VKWVGFVFLFGIVERELWICGLKLLFDFFLTFCSCCLMISLGRRDARDDLGLGFGSEREMEDTELEEGEACSYHNINTNNDDDYDESIDPDTALSYIVSFFFSFFLCNMSVRII
jgi:hypothetical protein